MKTHKLNPKNFIMDEITSIELVGDMDTIDVTVEDTHMFFANDIYSHNSSAESEIVQGHQVADSYKKIMISDFILSLSRTVEDKASGTGRIHIVKNRFGPDGLTYGTSINAGNGNFTVHDKATVAGRKETAKAFKKDGLKRDYYRQKFNELNGNTSEKAEDNSNKEQEN